METGEPKRRGGWRPDRYKNDLAYREGVKRAARQQTERKLAFLRERKNVLCTDCQIAYPYYVMDFDHVRGPKCFNPGKAASYSWTALIEELDKCEVVCANCHRTREHNRRGIKYAA
jgi:hypothetical protein